jgi:transcription antitermination factor NusG
MEMNYWYALQVRPKYEKISETGLQNKGYEVFLPTYRKRQETDRTAIDRPLFPGYLFCRMTQEFKGQIVTTPGVMKILSFGGHAAVVKDQEIEDIRVLVRSDVMREPWQYLPAGCIVQVCSGPLQGLTGVLLSIKDTRHIIVSVSILQRSVAAVLDSNTAVSVLYTPQLPATRMEQMAVRLAGEMIQPASERLKVFKTQGAA